MGEDNERDARENSSQPVRRLRGGTVTGGKETGRKETGGQDTRVKAMGMREMGGDAKGTKVSGVKATGAQDSQETGGKVDRLMDGSEIDNSLPGDKTAGQNMTEGIQRKSYSDVVIEGVRRRARVCVGDSIVWKTDRVLNKGDDVVVCLPGAKIEAITERVENIMGLGKGGSVLVHVGTNNVEREGKTAIVRKYRQLVRTLKQTRIKQIIL